MRTTFGLMVLALMFPNLGTYAQWGTLDPSFGGDGIVTTWFNHWTYNVRWVGVQPDGKVIGAGEGGPDRFTVVRYNSDGTPDSTFGGSGIASLSMTVDGSAFVGSGLLQPDGKIVVSGMADEPSSSGMALARFNADGSVDGTFGINGIVVTDVTPDWDGFYSVALRSDSGIVAVGRTTTNNDFDRIIVAQYDAFGVLDTTFGDAHSGLFRLPEWPYGHTARDVAIQSDGKILVAGYGDVGQDDSFVILRLLPDGTLDDSYGSGGITTTYVGHPSNAFALALEPDGKAVVAGSAEDFFGHVVFAAARYTTDGALDPTFGTNGMVTNYFPGSSWAQAYDVAIMPDGHIVLAGTAQFDEYKFAIACYDSTGVLDPTFGNYGMQVTAVALDAGVAYAATADGEGRLIVGGHAPYFVDGWWYGMFALARYSMAAVGAEEFGWNGREALVFPNPAKRSIMIDGVRSGDRATVRSVCGQLVLSVLTDDGVVDVASLRPGSYFLEVERAGRICERSRFMIE